MILMENLRIPKNERHRFTHPLGKLIAGKRDDTILEVKNVLEAFLEEDYTLKIYTVGDIVTLDFIGDEFLKKYIQLSIIDEKTQRKEIQIDFQDIFNNIIEFENPKGEIRVESFSLLSEIINSNKKTILKITRGEEDLLVLPLVVEISLENKVKNLIFYGQPPITDAMNPIPEGIVLVDVDEKIQQQVKNLLTLMEKF